MSKPNGKEGMSFYILKAQRNITDITSTQKWIEFNARWPFRTSRTFWTIENANRSWISNSCFTEAAVHTWLGRLFRWCISRGLRCSILLWIVLQTHANAMYMPCKWYRYILCITHTLWDPSGDEGCLIDSMSNHGYSLIGSSGSRCQGDGIHWGGHWCVYWRVGCRAG